MSRLSVFPGDFDPEAAKYVCAGDGIEPDEMADLLAGLAGRSVVLRVGAPPGSRAGGGSALGARFRLPDPLREYGGHRLRATGEKHRLLRRHRDWYLGVATWGEVEWSGPHQAETAERTGTAHPDLRTALEFCLAEPGEEQSALRLAGALWFYWAGCGHPGEGRRWLDRALALAPEPTEARAKALWVTGYLATLQGDPASARPVLEECRRQALATGDDRALAHALHRQGCAALIGDEPALATGLFEEALRRYRAIGELDSTVLMAMVELGLARLFQGDRPGGAFWLGRVRELCERHGERWAYAWGLYALAYAHWLDGDIRLARVRARESVRLSHRLHDLPGIALAIDVLALLETEPTGPDRPGDLREARVLQGAAHRIWRAVGRPFFGSRGFGDPHRICERRAGAGLTGRESAGFFGRGARLGLDAAVRRALGGHGDAEDRPGGRPGERPME
ncbi:ATP-binding protein [Kitasatospora sp. NPDC088548]|uniref:ATP-binding protein n=1 Tax=Kitasatospora sp. NPDC088548 TaxID=3364075 RepID=UPI00382A0E19